MSVRIALVMLGVPLFVCSQTTFGQSVPNPTDTSYVMALLRKGENIENKKVTVALSQYQKAWAFARKINYTKGYFESVRLMAYTLNRMGRHDEARKLAQEALLKAKQDTSKRNLGISYFALANTALYRGDFGEAIPNYQQAAHYMQLLGKRKNIAVINQNLGHIYETQRMYAQAVEFYSRSLAFNITDTTDRRSIAIDYFSIGTALSKQGKIRESRAYYQKARQYINPENDLDLMTNIYHNIGHSFKDEAKYDSTLYYEQKALALSRNLANPVEEIQVLVSMAQTYNKMGKYAQARTLLDKVASLTQKNEVSPFEFRNLYREYYYAYSGLHNYKEALKWSDKHDTLDSLLVTQETKEFLRDYEVKLKQAESRQRIAEKQRQIIQLKEDRQRQKLWLLIAILTAVLVGIGSVLGYLYYRQRQRTADNALLVAERERELAVVQSELQGQQKERLRISKEMHDDLGASLTAIGLLSEVVKTRMGPNTTPEVEKISNISADMVTAMNEIIWSLNTKNDSLNGLIAYTRSYASEFVDNTDLLLHTDVEESPHEIPIRGIDRRNVFLTVKEALNNVVKHAQATEVTLRIQPEADQLMIEVRDNGKGFTPSEKTRLRNGLGNMQNRMAESGGQLRNYSVVVGNRCKNKVSIPQPVGGENTPNVV